MNTTRIVKEITAYEFKEIISRYKSNIYISPHAFDVLSDAQRKVFKEEDLIKHLTNEEPAGIGLQRNGRYAAFYRRKNGYIRIICAIKLSRLEIVTFMNTDNMPNLKRIENDY